MSKLPDLDALAVFAKLAETRSFSATAEALCLSKATVSKAVSRLEDKLGTTLLHRTSRRFSLTESGERLAVRAAAMLSEAEAAEQEASDGATPRGLVRLAAPMSFGSAFVAPSLPEFLQAHPEITVELHLSDAITDLVGNGFDCALRIANLPDSSLTARRVRDIRRFMVASPAYLEKHGRPTHPRELAHHACLGYTHLPTAKTWHFIHRDGEEIVIAPSGPLRANNADALTAALCAGLGLAAQPDFICWRDIQQGRLVPVLEDWNMPPIALHIVAPSGAPRPARVAALMDFLAQRLSMPLWPGDTPDR
jgi:DNA-binding transcriptional LysR family regulator